jgi:DNA excision repair protein ERCC-2
MSTTKMPVSIDDALSRFPYDSPRPSQEDGMEAVIETVSENGYLLLEGACGTGKTILALTPLVELVRSRETKFKRVLVITSVKQQKRAFEEAVRDLNGTLAEDDDPITALSLTGKQDVTPYAIQGLIDKYDVFAEVDRLRDTTRDIINDGNSGDERREIARELYQQARVDHDSEWPYGDRIPTVGDGNDKREYSPYYARHMAALIGREMEKPGSSPEPVVPFSPESVGVITPDLLVDRCARKAGVSPHGVMGELLDEVEVVIGNFNHVFDPLTVEVFTDGIINDETLLVIDEAHNLVPRVRDLLSYNVDVTSLKRAKNEIDEASKWLSGELDETSAVQAEVEETATETFSDYRVSKSDLGKTAALFEAVYEKVAARIDTAIEDEWGRNWRSRDNEFEPLEVPLRAPDEAETDILTRWVDFTPEHDIETAQATERVATAVHAVREKVYTSHFGYQRVPDASLPTAGKLLSAWTTLDPVVYFREIVLYPREHEPSEPDFGWERYFAGKLTLRNCIPRTEIAERLDEFAGGMLMSATLAPMDIFRTVSGMNVMEDNDRVVTERQYGLPFPISNRASHAVDAIDFRGQNRKGPWDKYGNPNLDNKTRQQYAQAVLDLVETTDGNVLIGMPSYTEAEWAGEVIKDAGAAPANAVIIDESSSDWETERLKNRFFTGGKKVLVTALHGTLVEGVDYEGEKLKGVMVCGLPLPNTREPYQQAIRTAYDVEFGRDVGYEYAFSLPAVHKARQTIGRAIRSETDTGTRVLVDQRYSDDDCWGSVRQFLPEDEKEEFDKITLDSLKTRLKAFWNYQMKRGNE